MARQKMTHEEAEHIVKRYSANSHGSYAEALALIEAKAKPVKKKVAPKVETENDSES